MEYLPFVVRTELPVCADGNREGIARSLALGTGVNSPEGVAIIASEGVSSEYG